MNRSTYDELERETGIEPATNGLGSRDSTTELLPLNLIRQFYPTRGPDCQANLRRVFWRARQFTCPLSQFSLRALSSHTIRRQATPGAEPLFGVRIPA